MMTSNWRTAIRSALRTAVVLGGASLLAQQPAAPTSPQATPPLTMDARVDAVIGRQMAGTLVPAAMLAQMWTPARLADGRPAEFAGIGYGFGWFLERFRGHRQVYHGGSTGTCLYDTLAAHVVWYRAKYRDATLHYRFVLDAAGKITSLQAR